MRSAKTSAWAPFISLRNDRKYLLRFAREWKFARREDRWVVVGFGSSFTPDYGTDRANWVWLVIHADLWHR